MKKFTLNEKDYSNAKLLLEQEHISPLNKEEMFRAGLYCILAQAERYDKQIRIYRRLLDDGIDTPDAIIKKKEQLHLILKRSHFPNMKEERITGFAAWYAEDALPYLIMNDASNGHKNGVKMRNKLAETAPAMSYKSASLFMIKCGYEDVIPIDLWVIRYLIELGHDLRKPDYTTVGGITDSKKYLELEGVLRKIAKKNGVSLALFQAALWGKFSKWRVRRERRLF